MFRLFGVLYNTNTGLEDSNLAHGYC